MRRTLVTGATGFIGSHLARLLVERGDDVQVIVRAGSSLGILEDLDVRPARADVLDRRSIRRAMRGVERVFHVAGVTDLNAARGRTISLNVEGMRIVLEEALRADVERTVYSPRWPPSDRRRTASQPTRRAFGGPGGTRSRSSTPSTRQRRPR